tara:strand:+ start:157 stop:1566 length:1410 start_codon:yes stop_codon:yes gene_type:complete
MKKILLCFLLISSIVHSQDIKSYITNATFNSQEGSFVELYIAFDANSLFLVPSNNSFFAKIDVNIEIKNDDVIVYSDHYILNSPLFDLQMDNDVFFFDQQRVLLSDGKYDISVSVFDVSNVEKVNVYSDSISINYTEKLSISDIQLISEYNRDTIESQLSKSGMLMTPFVSNYYPQNISDLSFYFEVYNSKNISSNKYVLNSYIETFDRNIPLFDFNKLQRKTSENFAVNLLSFDITNLATGNYNLVCEIKDINNQSLIKKKIFFQRSNSFSGFKNNNDIYAVSTIGTFAEFITDKAQLKLFIDYLYPISTPDENIFAQNQIKNNDVDLMQKYFYNFWVNRDPKNPDLAWNEYHNKVKSVNSDFKNFRIQGYLTDRGRVYLQYGAPNSMHKVENASSTYPYEIWHYYKLNNQSNKKFVFVNADFATNEYRLEYSNVYGEVSNSEWHDKINYDNKPTFGDDFNNNYINPR